MTISFKFVCSTGVITVNYIESGVHCTFKVLLLGLWPRLQHYEQWYWDFQPENMNKRIRRMLPDCAHFTFPSTIVMIVVLV